MVFTIRRVVPRNVVSAGEGLVFGEEAKKSFCECCDHATKLCAGYGCGFSIRIGILRWEKDQIRSTRTAFLTQCHYYLLHHLSLKIYSVVMVKVSSQGHLPAYLALSALISTSFAGNCFFFV
jgi:hypothetical protein